MLQTKAVTPTTLELLIKLMQDNELNNFVLVGGTALALQLNHRISVDLDLFTNISFNEKKLTDYLKKTYLLEVDFIENETIKGEIKGIKIDCIAHKYPWVKGTLTEKGIRFASLEDIAAMKLNAIVGDGSRLKDFVDIACLSKKISLNDMCKAFEKKYDLSRIICLKALLYFDDIDFNESIQLVDDREFVWSNIESTLYSMVKEPNKIF